MHNVKTAIRQTLRRLAQAPAFTGVVVLTLAVGIGANTSIFSVVHALLLRPLPYAEAERLVELNHFYPTLNNLEASLSPFGYREYSESATSFDVLAAQGGFNPTLTERGEAQRLSGSAVSVTWFDVFGRPNAGRTFAATEAQPGNNSVVVLSQGLAQRLFAGETAALGQTLMLDGLAHEVVGVMPAGFRDFYNPAAQVWRPLALTPEQLGDPNGLTSEWLQVTGRLRPGVTRAAANAELERIAARFHELAAGELPDGWTIRATSLEQRARGDLRPRLLLLAGAVGFVLLIACVNVANLLLARGAGRTREVAVRTALGATRGAIVRQLLLESVVVAVAGGVIGVVLSYWVVAVVAGAVPPQLMGADGIAVDATALLFALALSVTAGLLFGLAPALQAARHQSAGRLRTGGRGSTDAGAHGVRRVLVVAEMALALTLLAGAGLLIRSLDQLQNVDPGFDPAGVLTFNVSLSPEAFPAQPERTLFFTETADRIRALPGVTAVGTTTLLPFGGDLSTRSFMVAGHEQQEGPGPWGEFHIVSEGYADALGIRVLRGRFFTEQDRADSHRVAVVDELLAQRYWPDADPIGQRVALPAPPGEEVWREVVGVVAHTQQDGYVGEDRVQLYYSMRQATSLPFSTFVVRATGDPQQLEAAVRGAVRSMHADVPVHRVVTMAELMRDSVAQRRLTMSLLATFAAVALLLAAIGIYGVMSQLVTDRTRELGVRMALGATGGDVIRLVLRQALGLTGAGVALGILGALALTRFIEGQLFGVGPIDPVTYVAVTAVLAGSAILATLIPAARAARLQPTRALRAE